MISIDSLMSLKFLISFFLQRKVFPDLSNFNLENISGDKGTVPIFPEISSKSVIFV